ncbi:hypothetical protein TCSYLVIO_003343 [Trypanosoma cruzi]|nr:hypothetical protein TCSYLVIO_003343 [Trypanosoma cruzi]
MYVHVNFPAQTHACITKLLFSDDAYCGERHIFICRHAYLHTCVFFFLFAIWGGRKERNNPKKNKTTKPKWEEQKDASTPFVCVFVFVCKKKGKRCQVNFPFLSSWSLFHPRTNRLPTPYTHIRERETKKKKKRKTPPSPPFSQMPNRHSASHASFPLPFWAPCSSPFSPIFYVPSYAHLSICPYFFLLFYPFWESTSRLSSRIVIPIFIAQSITQKVFSFSLLIYNLYTSPSLFLSLASLLFCTLLSSPLLVHRSSIRLHILSFSSTCLGFCNDHFSLLCS